MGEKTEKNLADAFAAESKASVRNAAFAMKAEKEDLSQIAGLFRAVSDAESVHANRFLLLMRGKIGSTEENLKEAFENEIKANTERYSVLIRDAVDEGASSAVQKAFTHSRDVESHHAELYKKAVKDMRADRLTEYYVCQICGNISENNAPQNCPICGAVQSRFKKVI
ncbi:rubrerythrin family protein [Thermodesulfobacteriota bacterium]